MGSASASAWPAARYCVVVIIPLHVAYLPYVLPPPATRRPHNRAHGPMRNWPVAYNAVATPSVVVRACRQRAPHIPRDARSRNVPIVLRTVSFSLTAIPTNKRQNDDRVAQVIGVIFTLPVARARVLGYARRPADPPSSAAAVPPCARAFRAGRACRTASCPPKTLGWAS